MSTVERQVCQKWINGASVEEESKRTTRKPAKNCLVLINQPYYRASIIGLGALSSFFRPQLDFHLTLAAVSLQKVFDLY